MCEGGEVDARARARLVVAHEVLRAMRRRDFRNDVAETNTYAQHVLIPALPDDTMGEFFDQLREAAGTIYVATLEGDDVAVISMAPARLPRHAAPQEDECPIYRGTELQMVIEYLRARRTPLTCYEADPSVQVELIDEGPSMPAVPSLHR